MKAPFRQMARMLAITFLALASRLSAEGEPTAWLLDLTAHDGAAKNLAEPLIRRSELAGPVPTTERCSTFQRKHSRGLRKKEFGPLLNQATQNMLSFLWLQQSAFPDLFCIGQLLLKASGSEEVH